MDQLWAAHWKMRGEVLLPKTVDEIWHNHTLPKDDPKKYLNQVTLPLSSADISIEIYQLLFYQEIHI